MDEATKKYRMSAKGRLTTAMSDKRRYDKYKAQILAHYGPKCNCCGFTDVRALSLDHVNGGGNAHRRRVGRGRAQLRWVILNGFPKDFQILCMNCQFIKRHENKECPVAGEKATTTVITLPPTPLLLTYDSGATRV